MSSSSDPTEPNSDAGSDRRNALIIGVVAVLAAIAVIVAVVVASGDDDEDASGGCLADLARRLPNDLDIAVVDGTDLAAAREHGYDDSSRESMVETADIGIHPDPLTRQVIFQMFDMEADLGYQPADVECWIGTPGEFVAQGEFDADRIAGSEHAGEMLVVSEDGRFLATDESFLEEPDGDEPGPLASTVAALGDDVVQVTLHQPRGGREPDGTWWIGSGLTPEGSTRWDVTMVWSYDDAAIAEDAEPLLRDLLRGESRLSEFVSGDPSDLLERDGGVLSFRSRALGGPREWMQVFVQFDPALVFDPQNPAPE